MGWKAGFSQLRFRLMFAGYSSVTLTYGGGTYAFAYRGSGVRAPCAIFFALRSLFDGASGGKLSFP